MKCLAALIFACIFLLYLRGCQAVESVDYSSSTGQECSESNDRPQVQQGDFGTEYCKKEDPLSLLIEQPKVNGGEVKYLRDRRRYI